MTRSISIFLALTISLLAGNSKPSSQKIHSFEQAPGDVLHHEPFSVSTFQFFSFSAFQRFSIYLNTSSNYSVGLLQGYGILRGYDNAGRRIGTAVVRNGTEIHTTEELLEDPSERILAVAAGDIRAVPVRDLAGRITGYQWGIHAAPGQPFTPIVTQTWERDTGGRIISAGSNVTNAPEFTYLLAPNNPGESFDHRGRRLKCETSGGTWTYEYGIAGQLTMATHPTLGTFNYAFDAIGRRTDKGAANEGDILNQTAAWTHDQAQKLTINAHPNGRVWFNGVEISNFTGQHQETLAPPAAGEWFTWQTLAILEGAGEGAGNPPANPLASPDAKAEQRGAVWIPPAQEEIAYDAAGNRQGNAQWDYGWDAKNQLTRVRTKNHETAPQAYDITFIYDSEGRRVRKHVVELQDGTVVSEKVITFIWDGWDLLYERHQDKHGNPLLERKYLWGPDIADGSAGGAGGLLLIQETRGTTTTQIIPLYDGTGHVTALTNLNKDLLATYAYGPFGEKIHATGPMAQSNPWRWVTKYLDEETGLYYFGHRYYDPITGQWLSREPLGESESVNLYSYCHNDPVNAVDVLGLAEHRFTIHDRDTYLQLFGMEAGTLLYDAFERRSDLYENLGLPGTVSNDIGLNSVVHKFLTGYSDQSEVGQVAANGIMWFESKKLTNQYRHLIGPWVDKTTFRHDAHTGEFLIGNGSLTRQSTGVLGSVFTVPVFRNHVDSHPIYWIATDTVAEHENAISFAARTLELGRVADFTTQIAEIAPFGAVNRFIPGTSPIPFRHVRPPVMMPKVARPGVNITRPGGGTIYGNIPDVGTIHRVSFGETLWIEKIFVNQGLRNQGNSIRLYQALLREAPATRAIRGEIGRVNLEVFQRTGNINFTPRARALSRLGFTQHEYDPVIKVMISTKP